MNRISKILLSIFVLLICIFTYGQSNLEYIKLQKFELKALRKNIIGKIYVYDLTHKKGCNKSEIKYLGEIKTKKGKRFKILTSFFVFSNSGDMCQGTSNIKIYDLKNRYIGKYYIGMSYDLPDSLKNNKLLYFNNIEQCSGRKGKSIDLSNGLPKKFFLECAKGFGNEYTFE